jgi:hypothetical protein
LATRGSVSNYQDVQNAIAAADSDSDGEDDEFFDAIEANTLPNLKLYDSIAHPERPGTPSTAEAKTMDFTPATVDDTGKTAGTIKEALARKSLEPYAHVRNKLPIDDDKRPSVSCESGLFFEVGG